jgi:hypothetical protein
MLNKKEVLEMVVRELELLIYGIRNGDSKRYIEFRERNLFDTVEACSLVYNRQHKSKKYIGGNDFIEEALTDKHLEISVLFNHYFENSIGELANLLSIRGIH